MSRLEPSSTDLESVEAIPALTKSEQKELVAEELRDFFPDSNLNGLVVRRRKASSSSIDVDDPRWDEPEAPQRNRRCSIDVDRPDRDSVRSDQELARGYRRRADAGLSLDLQDNEYVMKLVDPDPLAPNPNPNPNEPNPSQNTRRRRAVSMEPELAPNSPTAPDADSRSSRSTSSLLVQSALLRSKELDKFAAQDLLLSADPRDSIMKKKRRPIFKKASRLGYRLKMKSGEASKIPFVKNPVHKYFSDLYQSETPTQMIFGNDIDLWEILIQNEKADPDSKPSRLHRQQRAKKTFAHTFRPLLAKTTPGFLTAFRTKPPEKTTLVVPRSVSPPLKKPQTRAHSKTMALPLQKNLDLLDLKKYRDNGAKIELEKALDSSCESDDFPPPEPALTTMVSATPNVRMSGGAFFGSATKLPALLRTSEGSNKSMDFDLAIQRVNSVTNMAAKLRSSEVRPAKNQQKYRVLEHSKDLAKGTIDLVIIMNDSTTLKIKIANEQLAFGEPGPERRVSNFAESFSESEQALTRELNALGEGSSSEEEEFPLLGGFGKYKILGFKPLLFARDPVRNRLFELVLDFVQRRVWFDTLHRFLGLVNTIYSDLISFYLKLLKELAAAPPEASVEGELAAALLVVRGSVKDTPVVVRASVFSNGFTAQYDTGAERPGFKKVKAPPRPTPPKELTSCQSDEISAFKQFLSSFI